MSEQHRKERLVAALYERYQHRLEKLKEWAVTGDGRPMFTIELTPREQLDRYLAPEFRKQILDDISKGEGADGVADYDKRMQELVRRFLIEGRRKNV